MPETLDTSHGSPRWLWHSIGKDLEEQGDLPGVVIDPLSVDISSCAGRMESGVAFALTWQHEEFLLVSTLVEAPELIEAFTKIIGYRPFCRYTMNKLITFEWDKRNPEQRLNDMRQRAEVTNLQSLTP